MPMPSDFAIRLACGLCAMLLLTSHKAVPPAFFRTVCLVAMGLLVTAGLTSIGAINRIVMIEIVAAGVFAYLASAFWGLGVPRVAIPATAIVVAICGVLLVRFEGGPVSSSRLMAFNVTSRLVSAALLGSSMAAMLLGHHYLTAPAMSIDPLKRFVIAMAVSLAVRTVLASIGLGIVVTEGATAGVGLLFLGMRWGMGVLGPGVASYLTWQTVRIRSTQSATGILYIGVTLVLFGELSGMILGRAVGIEL